VQIFGENKKEKLVVFVITAAVAIFIVKEVELRIE